MDIEIKIGREVEGANVCRVPSSYSKVSRLHAILYWHNGMVTLEDRSSNGTFVNGNRISTATVRENDVVWLGANGTSEGYQLDLRGIFASCRQKEPVQRPAQPQQAVGTSNAYSQAANSQRTDYSAEFPRLKQAYINYHDEMSELTKKANLRMQLPRLLLSLIPTALGVVFMVVFENMTMKFIALSVGGLLSGLIGTLTMGRSNSKKEKMNEDILDLQLKYQKEYRCPKCGKDYNLELHWKKLQADGKCPYGCGAKF